MEKVQLYFKRDRSKVVTASVSDTSYLLLPNFLLTDIQEETTAKELLKALESKNPPVELFSGNGHSLTLTPKQGILIESSFDESAQPLQLPVATLYLCLQKWIEFLETPGLLSLSVSFSQ